MKRRSKRTKAAERAAKLAALARATRRMELEAIRERLALRPEERMDFLRVRLPGGGSTL